MTTLSDVGSLLVLVGTGFLVLALSYVAVALYRLPSYFRNPTRRHR